MDKKKIDLFKDSEYEGFDWLNRAIEPTLFSLADKFTEIPSKIELSIPEAIAMANGHHWNPEITAQSVIFDRAGINIDINDMSFLKEFLGIDLGEKELIVDLRDIPADKIIVAYKIVDTLSEDVQRRLALKKISGIFNNYRYARNVDIGRLNEIMDILGCEDNRRSRSSGTKLNSIYTCYENIILEDKWRIRNLDLAISVAKWIMHYATDGNIASFQNFVKLKCMTHSENPIYSIQETI